MDLSDSDDHHAFRQEVKSFLARHGANAPRETTFNYRLEPKRFSEETKAWQRLLVEHGYACRDVPSAYGGFGAEPDILKSKIIADEFFAADVTQGLTNQGISMFVPTLLMEGSEDQKSTWIAPTINGDIVW